MEIKENEFKMKSIFLVLSSVFFISCATSPQLESQKIRQWTYALGNEYPNEKAVIAHYKKADIELFYLAARHTNTMGDDTLNLVKKLFETYQFNVLIIESIPYSFGESPKWFVEDAKKGKSDTFIQGGESALAVIYADSKKIPFFAGEPDHRDIYKGLKERGYTDEDVVGFYTLRQIPQWIREKENKKDLLKRKIPSYVSHYCKVFGISTCPSYDDVIKWYKTKLGRDLVPDVSNEEVAPYADGELYTQKMSSNVGFIRDHFTLKIIEQMIKKYKKVAVVYGAGHFLTLRKSFDASFGEPTFIEDKK